ncbi:S8 family peptidase [Halococcus salifodinae]|uniref:Subtilisin-like serine protease n=1 Tax=Halococcus salifodinae DSM 8989 TaxID=1227456 RepID=M0MWY9_9EURY|nr:S8 family serine peptidase [Halococcus salifodinae]EMA49838.1 subtilisin-like serine protease [Halococcus salifodinae DSM 8989]
MNERIVFAREPAEFLEGMDCDVVETYHFGDVGSAALVECEAEHESAIADDDRVLAIEANYEIEPHVEPAHVSEERDTVATIEDVRRLHDVPEDDATGAGLTVVAMDSGIDPDHPVFEDVAIQQVDVTGSGTGDAVGHGTAVLGQITRTAPEADLIALRIFGAEGRTKNNVIMRAYEWLHDNTDAYDVVNMSWGSQENSRAINRVHNGLVETGIRDVVSAGNSGKRSGSPATAERAFSIAACTEDGAIAEFSSYNPDRDNPDVAAIGKDNRLAQASGTTMGTDLDGPWVKSSGTSFSAPEVAGMVAKYLDAGESTEPETIMRDFEAAARDIPDQPRDGAGLADYAAAVRGDVGDER